MQYCVFAFLLLFVTNTSIASNTKPQIKQAEPVTELEFVVSAKPVCAAQLQDVPKNLAPSLPGEVLFGVMLAANESGIEVGEIESDACSPAI